MRGNDRDGGWPVRSGEGASGGDNQQLVHTRPRSRARSSRRWLCAQRADPAIACRPQWARRRTAQLPNASPCEALSTKRCCWGTPPKAPKTRTGEGSV